MCWTSTFTLGKLMGGFKRFPISDCRRNMMKDSVLRNSGRSSYGTEGSTKPTGDFQNCFCYNLLRENVKQKNDLSPLNSCSSAGRFVAQGLQGSTFPTRGPILQRP